MQRKGASKMVKCGVERIKSLTQPWKTWTTMTNTLRMLWTRSTEVAQSLLLFL